MAEAVVLALGKISLTLAGAAVSNVGEQHSTIKELPGMVERIEAKLLIINGALQQLDPAHLNDTAFMGWIKFVRDQAYRVEDVMDRYSYHDQQQKNSWFKWTLTNVGLGPFGSIYEEITEIEKNLREATELKQSLLEQFKHLPKQIGKSVLSTDSNPDEPKRDQDLIRMEDKKRLMTKWLHSSDSHSRVITVFGEGGLGNTTLVMEVYNREKIKFPAHGFIVVEKATTMDALLRKILLKIGSLEQSVSASIDNMHANELKEQIKRRIHNLKDGRCLIVLDNVRDPKIYFEVCDVINNLKSSRIVITTRKTEVANARNPSSCFLRLQPFILADALSLFCKKAFFKNDDNKCPPELMGVATSIVEKCKGLPLAVVTMGGMMYSKPQNEHIWNQMHGRLTDELQRNADHVQAILNLSYHDMPGHLRNCLLYCTMFPEEYHMSRERLIRLWVAEGCVLTKNPQIQENMAEDYFMDLIRRNMLHVVDNDVLGKVSHCKMHDIVRKMVLLVAEKERFSSATDYMTMSNADKDTRHLSLYGWKDTSIPQANFQRLRSLVALGTNSSFTTLLSAIFSGSNFLTVLILQDSDVTEVPASIGNLFNLRYISLRRTKVKLLPESMEKLSNLDTLDIKQTEIQKLPHGIRKATKLRHILADRFAAGSQSDFRRFIALEAPKGLDKFGELQTLETVQANKDMARKLMKMMQLISVSVDNISSILCEEIFASLSGLQYLTSLVLSATDENEALNFRSLNPKSSYLRRLTVRGGWSGRTLDYPIFKDYGRNLTYVSLSWCLIEGDPLHFLGSHCRYLHYLCLHKVRSANSLSLAPPECCFRKLKTLVLEHMPDVSQLKLGDGTLECIEGMYVTALHNLGKVPQGIESLKSLKKLSLLELHKDFIADWERNEMNQKMSYVLELHI